VIGLVGLVVGAATGIAGRAVFGAEAGLGIGVGCALLAAYAVWKRLPKVTTEPQ